jgi:hypothetical protein
MQHLAWHAHFVSVAVGFATRLPSLTRFFLKSSAPAPPLVFENALVFGMVSKRRCLTQCAVLAVQFNTAVNNSKSIAHKRDITTSLFAPRMPPWPPSLPSTAGSSCTLLVMILQPAFCQKLPLIQYRA